MSLLIEAAAFQGDRAVGSTLHFMFNSTSAAGVLTGLTGSPAIAVYKDDGTTEDTSGVTLDVDFDSVTGLNHIAIDTSSDATFYAGGHDFEVVLTAGTVGAVSVAGTAVGHFTLAKCTATLSDGVAHGGTPGSSTATWALQAFNVTNSGGTAVTFQSTGSNGTGLRILGNGGGSAIHATGGDTGTGLAVEGGNTSGLGCTIYSFTSDEALSVRSFGGGEAVTIQGSYGIDITATTTAVQLTTNAGPAIYLHPFDGEGVLINASLSSNPSANGITVIGAGTGSAVQLGDGSIGAEGLKILAGTGGTGGDANGISVVGAGTGSALQLGDGATGGIALQLQPGPSANGIDIISAAKGINVLAADSGLTIQGAVNGAVVFSSLDSTPAMILGANGSFAGSGEHGLQINAGNTGAAIFLQNSLVSSSVNFADATGDGIRIAGGGTGNDITLAGNTLLSGQVGLIVRTSTAQGGTKKAIQLDSGASAVNNLYNGLVVYIYAGTGAGQARIISGYAGNTKQATVDTNWTTAPNATSKFILAAASEPVKAGNQTVISGTSKVVIHSGTAQTGSTSNTIKLDTAASTTNSLYNGDLITLTDGTGVGQTRTIVAYTGSTRVATVDKNWVITPTNTTQFDIYASTTPSVFSAQGVAQAATSNTITLDNTASAVDDTYNGSIITILSGTDAGDTAEITDYVGSTKVATISGTFAVTPDTTSSYAVIPTASGSGNTVGDMDVNVVTWAGAPVSVDGDNWPKIVLADTASHGGTLGSSTATLALKQVNVTSTGTAVQIASSGILTLNVLNTGTGGAALNLSATGSGGHSLNASGPSGGVIAGTAGVGLQIVSAAANPALQLGSSGSTGTAGLAILAGTNGGAGNANAVEVTGRGLGAGVLVTGGSTGVGMEIDGGAEGLRVAGGAGNNPGVLVLGAGTAAAIRAVADTGGNANAIEGIGDGTGAGFFSDPNAVGFGGGGSVVLASNGLDAVTIETGINARQSLAIIAAACAGVLSGAATTNVLIQAAGNASTNRIDATVDNVGNRSSVTLNPPA